MSARRHAANCGILRTLADGERRDEDPDGVVGVPAGGHRRPRPARPPPGHRARRGRPRGRGAQPPPLGTDPSTHPSTDEITEGVRVVAAAQDPHEFDFGTDMMAWTLAMGHSMVRAGLAIKGSRNRPWRPDVVHAHDWLVAHPGHRAGRILRCATGFHHPRHRGRQALGLGVGRDQPAGARRRVVAGARIRFAHHLFGVDERRDHRTVRPRPGRDSGDPQRNRRRPLAVRARGARDGARRSCCTSAGWSTRRAFTTRSRRCPASGAPIPAPR